jgi:hypothetical protein
MKSHIPRYREIKSIITMTTHEVDIVSFRAGQVTFFNSALTSLRKILDLANTFHTSFGEIVSICTNLSYNWQARRDSNPQHPVLETGALAVRATGLHTYQYRKDEAISSPYAKYAFYRSGNTF